MAAHVRNLTFDCGNAFAQAMFWAEVLEYEPSPGTRPGVPECAILGPDGRRLLFMEVPESKQVKNRVHLDLVASDRTPEQETERVVALGAVRVAEVLEPDGEHWVVLEDPEGNEFCVLHNQF
jgi:hypothetical protein